MIYKPIEMIATPQQWEQLQRVNPPRKKAADRFNGLRVKIVLVRDPSWSARNSPVMSSPGAVFGLMQEMLHAEVVESMWSLIVNAKHQVVGVYEAVRGSVTEVTMTPADLIRPVLVAGAPAFIMVHNHPSGDDAPSQQDKAITQRVKEAAKMLGLSLLDHLVIGLEGYTSFSTSGLL